MTIISIPLADASNQQLRYFAETVLGLEVPRVSNTSQMRAKIEAAMPGIADIRAPDSFTSADQPTAAAPIALGAPAPVAASGVPVTAVPDGVEGRHERFDPRVTLMVLPSSDKLRAKEVQVAVNGSVIMIQRGKLVQIPLRYYFALEAAIETVAIELDEIDPTTSLPMKEWQEQPSYPFSVTAMPSDEEIAAWKLRMNAVTL